MTPSLLPTRLRILGLTYDVRHVAETLPSVAAGEMRPFFTRIQVDVAASPERARVTLLHEVVESINHELELNLKHRNITSLATAINQVLADNPALVALYAEAQLPPDYQPTREHPNE